MPEKHVNGACEAYFNEGAQLVLRVHVRDWNKSAEFWKAETKPRNPLVYSPSVSRVLVESDSDQGKFEQVYVMCVFKRLRTHLGVS